MSNKIKKSIDELFTQWNDSSIEYIVMRGWDGKRIKGADIDILLSDKTWGKAQKILKQNNFKKEKRIFCFFDLFAKELYYNMPGINKKFHLTNKLLFGKPARRVRIPIEDKVFEHKTRQVDGVYFVMKKEFVGLLTLLRLMIDKPKKIGKIEHFVFYPLDKEISLFDKQFIKIVNKIYEDYKSLLIKKDLENKKVIKNTLKLVKKIRGCEYKRRKIQSSISNAIWKIYHPIYKKFL